MKDPVSKALLNTQITLAFLQLEIHEKIVFFFQRDNHRRNRKEKKISRAAKTPLKIAIFQQEL